MRTRQMYRHIIRVEPNTRRLAETWRLRRGGFCSTQFTSVEHTVLRTVGRPNLSYRRPTNSLHLRILLDRQGRARSGLRASTRTNRYPTLIRVFSCLPSCFLAIHLELSTVIVVVGDKELVVIAWGVVLSNQAAQVRHQITGSERMVNPPTL